jgi:hypothetical protein
VLLLLPPLAWLLALLARLSGAADAKGKCVNAPRRCCCDDALLPLPPVATGEARLSERLLFPLSGGVATDSAAIGGRNVVAVVADAADSGREGVAEEGEECARERPVDGERIAVKGECMSSPLSRACMGG